MELSLTVKGRRQPTLQAAIATEHHERSGHAASRRHPLAAISVSCPLALTVLLSPLPGLGGGDVDALFRAGHSTVTVTTE